MFDLERKFGQRTESGNEVVEGVRSHFCPGEDGKGRGMVKPSSVCILKV